MLFRSAAVAAATFAMVSAQRVYEIDPESVPESLRENWCMNSERSCPLICQQYDNPSTIVNTCDPETLTYGCLCGDNIKPNMSEYSLTIPYFTCMEWGNQCVDDCGGSSSCGAACREDNPCGAQDPERVNATETSSLSPTASQTGGASETDDGTTIYTGAPGSEDDDDDSSNNSADNSNSGGDDEGAASLLTFGASYGLTVVLGGMFLGFTLF